MDSISQFFADYRLWIKIAVALTVSYLVYAFLVKQNTNQIYAIGGSLAVGLVVFVILEPIFNAFGGNKRDAKNDEKANLEESEGVPSNINAATARQIANAMESAMSSLPGTDLENLIAQVKRLNGDGDWFAVVNAFGLRDYTFGDGVPNWPGSTDFKDLYSWLSEELSDSVFGDDLTAFNKALAESNISKRV